ncbi:hypothetical protein ACFPRL_12150 [Pseudoclavibacter helvolus]
MSRTASATASWSRTCTTTPWSPARQNASSRTMAGATMANSAVADPLADAGRHRNTRRIIRPA